MRAWLLVAAFVVTLIVPSTAAATQTRDDPDEPVPSDVRRVSWDVDGGQVALTLTIEPGAQELYAFLDTGGDGEGDYVVGIDPGSDTATAIVARTPNSSSTCQHTSGEDAKDTAHAPHEDAGGGLVRFTIRFATADIGGATSFRWVVAGRGSDANQQVHVDFVPDGAGSSSQACDNGAGIAASMSSGVAFPDPAGQQPPPQQPSPPPPPPARVPPTAVLTLARPAPASGGVVEFTGAASRPGSARIVSYQWDLNGDGDFEANTGTRPTASYVGGAAGSHIARLRVVDALGQTSDTTAPYELSRAARGCTATKLARGDVRIRAACIKTAGTGGSARAAQDGARVAVEGVADFNGLQVIGIGSSRQMVIDFAKGTIEAETGITVKLMNTPIGDIVIYRKTGKVIWALPVGGDAKPVSGQPGYRLATIAAGSGCTASERAYCAKLPGNFPMSGKIDVYLTPTAQIVLAANAELSTPFTVTGAVALRMVPQEGLKLDSLRFGMSNANFGIFTLEELRFVYEAPGTGDPFHEGELWEAALAVKLPTVPPGKVRGELRFVGGAFDYGLAELTVPGGIPVGPGILLNRFRGEFGLTPTRIGGGLGVSLAAVAQVNGNFFYQSGGGTAQLHVDGDFALAGHTLATAYFDYFSTGYVGFGGRFFFNPGGMKVDGRVDGWFEGQEGGGTRFQVEGDVHVTVWIIDARVRGIVNNEWIAACASVKTFLGRVGGYVAYRFSDGNIDAWFGCNMGAYRIAPLRHSPAARAAQAGEGSVQVRAGEEALELELSGRGGPPVVTLIGPGGERYTTPSRPGEIATDGTTWVAAQYAEGQRTIVRIEKPAPGVWRIAPEGGSPELTGLRTSSELPDPRLRVRVARRGSGRVLRWTLEHPSDGLRVRLVERGRTTQQTICTVDGTRRSGTCPFRPGAGARSRRIEATYEHGGVPRRTATVGRYTAPSGKPGRPSRVRVARRGNRAIVTWRRARRATSYRVEVRSNDGRRELHVTRRRRVVVRGLVPEDTLRVRVRGEAGPTGVGPAARGSLRRARARGRRR